MEGAPDAKGSEAVTETSRSVTESQSSDGPSSSDPSGAGSYGVEAPRRDGTGYSPEFAEYLQE